MKANTAKAIDWAISPAWVIVSSRSLLDRSATSPANADSTRIGPNWQAASAPTATPLLVRCRTSSVSATIVSQLPEFEISWPMKNRRKLRDRSARTRLRIPARSRSVTDAPRSAVVARTA